MGGGAAAKVPLELAPRSSVQFIIGHAAPTNGPCAAQHPRDTGKSCRHKARPGARAQLRRPSSASCVTRARPEQRSNTERERAPNSQAAPLASPARRPSGRPCGRTLSRRRRARQPVDKTSFSEWTRCKSSPSGPRARLLRAEARAVARHRHASLIERPGRQEAVMMMLARMCARNTLLERTSFGWPQNLAPPAAATTTTPTTSTTCRTN